MKRLLFLLLKSSPRIVVVAAVAAIASGVINTVLLALLHRALGQEEARSANLAWIYFGTCTIVYFLRVASEIVLVRLGQETMYQLRLKLSRGALGLTLRRLELLGPHGILSTLTEDIPVITNTVAYLPLLTFNVTIVAACFGYMFILSKTVFLATLGFMIVGALAYQFPANRADKHFVIARQISDKLYEHFRALTEGMKELKLHRHRREAFLDLSLSVTAAQLRERFTTSASIYAIAASTGLFVAFLILGVLVFVAPLFFSVDREALVGYVLLFLYLMAPLQETMNSLPRLNRAGVALARIDRLGLELEAPGNREPLEPAADAPASWQSLELAGVAHSFYREGEDRDFVLGPLDMELEPGELVFVVGGNGSGKTTLAKLLVGLYEPESGVIRLDGRPVTAESLESYRQLFSGVFTDFFLFEDLLGLEGPELDRKAREYLSRLKLDHKVKIENGTLSTTELSQGQRKRLALLTAFLEDRPIYLFDEWAADQDPFFKEFFYYVLLPELKSRGKAVVVITHDDGYFDVADRIVALDYGQIVPYQEGRFTASPRRTVS